MPKLKNLSGSDLIAVFMLFGFEIKSQKGSHVKLGRVSAGEKEILTIPNHKEIDKGTLKAVYRQACRFIAEDELRVHFYHF